MAKLLLTYGISIYQYQYRYPRFLMDNGWCCAEANLDNTCWSFKSMRSTGEMLMQTELFEGLEVQKQMDCLVQNCICVVVVAWTQSSCWIYGINLVVQYVECISFCVMLVDNKSSEKWLLECSLSNLYSFGQLPLKS